MIILIQINNKIIQFNQIIKSNQINKLLKVNPTHQINHINQKEYRIIIVDHNLYINLHMLIH
jgi:hypothetical protein